METAAVALFRGSTGPIARRIFTGVTIILAVVSMIVEATGQWFEQLTDLHWSPMWYVAYGALTLIALMLAVAIERRDEAAITRIVPWAGVGMAVVAAFVLAFATYLPLGVTVAFWGGYVGICCTSPYLLLGLLAYQITAARPQIAEEDRCETWQAFGVLFALSVLVILSLWHVSPLWKF